MWLLLIVGVFLGLGKSCTDSLSFIGSICCVKLALLRSLEYFIALFFMIDLIGGVADALRGVAVIA